ncbi:MAG: glycine zipper family protein [Halioglobus sp.]|nr:glycine zipper family protein [Halioglobus sp.]|tara:strand:+ start:2511 stop:2882 length:372 start_codon:yes stop_codon:yes gene_type:complete
MNGHLPALVLSAGLIALLAGCTTTDEIIIDEKGVNMTAYQQDLAECRQYSQGVKTGEKGARGAASGAVVGAAVGAIFGGGDGALRGGGAGAVTGGARGVSEGERDEVQVVKQCLRGRGYRVLN